MWHRRSCENLVFRGVRECREKPFPSVCCHVPPLKKPAHDGGFGFNIPIHSGASSLFPLLPPFGGASALSLPGTEGPFVCISLVWFESIWSCWYEAVWPLWGLVSRDFLSLWGPYSDCTAHTTDCRIHPV